MVWRVRLYLVLHLLYVLQLLHSLSLRLVRPCLLLIRLLKQLLKKQLRQLQLQQWWWLELDLVAC